MNNTVSTYSYRNIWKVAYPILISLVMEQMIGMTDTAFLGRVGEIELGAAAIGSIFYLVIFMIGFGFSIGSQIIIGRRNGEKRFADTGRIFWHGIYMLVALALAIILLSELFSPAIMKMMISSEHILDASMQYVRWRIPGLLFAFATVMFRAFYVGTTQTKTLTLNSIVMVLSNIFFNWVLIFGKLGIPALGISGAAIGSSLAELVSLLFFISYTSRKCDTVKYGMDRMARFDWKVLKNMLSVSVWTMIQHFVSVSTWFIFFMYIEHLGERALAISNIVRNVSGLIWMVLMAFSATCSTLVSNIIGEGHPESVMSLIKRVLKLTYSILAAVIAAFCIFPESIISIYTDIPDLISATVPSMIIMCISYAFNIAGNIFFNSVSGTGNTKAAFRLEMIALIIYMAYCTVVISIIRADVAVCWTAESIYAATLMLLSGLYLRSGRWKNKKV